MRWLRGKEDAGAGTKVSDTDDDHDEDTEGTETLVNLCDSVSS